MTISLIAIITATLVSYVAGSLWYLALGAPWRKALGWVETGVAYKPPVPALVVAFVGQLAMAIALGGLFSHLGFSGVRPGLILGAGLWLGLVLPTLAVNVVFQQRNPMLIAIDGGHWLLILAILGGVIGAFS